MDNNAHTSPRAEASLSVVVAESDLDFTVNGDASAALLLLSHQCEKVSTKKSVCEKLNDQQIVEGEQVATHQKTLNATNGHGKDEEIAEYMISSCHSAATKSDDAVAASTNVSMEDEKMKTPLHQNLEQFAVSDKRRNLVQLRNKDESQIDVQNKTHEKSGKREATKTQQKLIEESISSSIPQCQAIATTWTEERIEIGDEMAVESDGKLIRKSESTQLNENIILTESSAIGQSNKILSEAELTSTKATLSAKHIPRGSNDHSKIQTSSSEEEIEPVSKRLKVNDESQYRNHFSTPHCGCVSDHTTTTAATSTTSSSSIVQNLSVEKSNPLDEDCNGDHNRHLDDDIIQQAQSQHIKTEIPANNNVFCPDNEENSDVKLNQKNESDHRKDQFPLQKATSCKDEKIISLPRNHDVNLKNDTLKKSEDDSTDVPTKSEHFVARESNKYVLLSAQETNSEEIEYRNKTENLKKVNSSVQKLKIALYLEAMKVHAGSGAQRKFSEYWDSFGKYISSSFTQKITIPFTSITNTSTKRHRRSNNDIALNGVEAILDSFLTTKSLRKKHNSLIKALMKQCMQGQMLETYVKQHIPNQWKDRIRKVDKRPNEINLCPENNFREQQILDIKDIVEYDPTGDEEAIASDLGQNNSEFKNNTIDEDEAKETSQEHYQEKKEESEYSISHHLPGLLEIDHISRKFLHQTNSSFTSSGLCFVSNAVLNFVTEILKKSLVIAKDRHSKNEANETSTRKRKIRSFDVANSLNSFPTGIFRGSSRMVWERCLSEINLDSCLIFDPLVQKAQEEIANLIITDQSNKRLKIDDADASSNSITKSSRKGDSSNLSSSIGKGKNLAAMVLRHQMDELSRKGLSMTDDDDNESKQNLSISENNLEKLSRPPSTIGIEGTTNISPDPSFTSGQPASSLTQPSVKDTQQHDTTQLL